MNTEQIKLIEKFTSMPLILPKTMKWNNETGETEKVVSQQAVDGFYIVPETLQVLKDFSNRYPQLFVAIATIGGRLRSGKSYAGSRLQKNTNSFKLGNTMQSLTRGIWLGSTGFIREDNSLLLILDCEGLESTDQDKKNDDTLFVLCILLSSMFIYNSVGVATSNDLDKMQFIINISKSLQIKEGQRITMKDSQVLRQTFPDFIWLLRDAHLTPVDNNDQKCSPTEYLLKNVLQETEIDALSDTLQEDTKRNATKQTILEFFHSFHCMLIPPPTVDTEVIHSMETAETSKLNPAFNKEMEKFVDFVHQNTRTKKSFFNNSPISLHLFCNLVDEVMKVVSDPNAIPSLDSLHSSACKNVKNEMIKSLSEKYLQEMTEWQSVNIHVPLFDVFDKHEELFAKFTIEIQESLSFAEKKFIEESIKELQQTLIVYQEDNNNVIRNTNGGNKLNDASIKGGMILPFILKNEEASKKKCSEIAEKLWKPIEEKLNKHQEMKYDFNSFNSDSEIVLQQYDKEVSHLPKSAEVKQQLLSKIESQKGNIKNLDGYREEVAKEAKQRNEAEVKAQIVQQKMEEMQANNEEKLREHRIQMQAMEKQHQEETERLKVSMAEQIKSVTEKSRALLKANFKKRAAEQKRIIEEMGKQNQSTIEKMAQMNEQNAQAIANLNHTIQQMQSARRSTNIFSKLIDAAVKLAPIFIRKFVK